MSKVTKISPFNMQYDRGSKVPLDESSYMDVSRFNNELASYNTNFYRGHIVSVDSQTTTSSGELSYISPKVIESVKSSNSSAYNGTYTNIVVSKEAEHIIVENDISLGNSIPNSLYFILGGAIGTDAIQWGYISAYEGDPDIKLQADLYGSEDTDAPTLAYNYKMATDYASDVNDLYKRMSGAVSHLSIKNVPSDKGRCVVTNIDANIVSKEFTNLTGTATFDDLHLQAGDEIHWIIYNAYTDSLEITLPSAGTYKPTNNPIINLPSNTIAEVNFLKADYIYVRTIAPKEENYVTITKSDDVLDILPSSADAYIPEINVSAIIESMKAPAPMLLTPSVDDIKAEPWNEGIGFWGQIIGDITKQQDLYSSNNFSLTPVYSLLKTSKEAYDRLVKMTTGYAAVADNTTSIEAGKAHTVIVKFTNIGTYNIQLQNPDALSNTGFDTHVICVNGSDGNITINLPTDDPYKCIDTTSIVIENGDCGEINFVGADYIYVRSVGD